MWAHPAVVRLREACFYKRYGSRTSTPVCARPFRGSRGNTPRMWTGNGWAALRNCTTFRIAFVSFWNWRGRGASRCWRRRPSAGIPCPRPPGGGCARTARRRRHTGMLWRDCAPRIWSMPNERPAATWFSFLSDLDAQLREDVDLHCMGGSVVSQYYDCARETADLDVLGVVPVQATNQIEALAGKGSPLYRKYRVYLE